MGATLCSHNAAVDERTEPLHQRLYPMCLVKVRTVVWVVVSNIFYFHPYLGKIPILTSIFQRG